MIVVKTPPQKKTLFKVFSGCVILKNQIRYILEISQFLHSGYVDARSMRSVRGEARWCEMPKGKLHEVVVFSIYALSLHVMLGSCIMSATVARVLRVQKDKGFSGLDLSFCLPEADGWNSFPCFLWYIASKPLSVACHSYLLELVSNFIFASISLFRWQKAVCLHRRTRIVQITAAL